MVGGQNIYTLGDQLFIELFTGLKPDVFDFNVDFRCKPESLIRSWARSAILMGVPMSKINNSPPSPIEPGCKISWQAWGIVMKNLVTSGCVTVTGPPLWICFLNKGTTLPMLPTTFPNRTNKLGLRCLTSILTLYQHL